MPYDGTIIKTLCVKQGLETLPSVLWKNRRELPEHSAIYFMVSSYGEVVYIGRTNRLRLRFTNHHLKWTFQQLKDLRIAWLPWDNLCDLPRLEALLIQAFSPRLNRVPVPFVVGHLPSSMLPQGGRRAPTRKRLPLLPMRPRRVKASRVRLPPDFMDRRITMTREDLDRLAQPYGIQS